MSKRPKRGAARWCEENGIEPGHCIECHMAGAWVEVRVTAIGESGILCRRPKAAEFCIGDRGRLRIPEDR
jgi:hypothetical protein